MRTEKQIQASRKNGALSRGPLTPEGKFHCAHNATRHALLASTVVLEEECEDRFQALLAAFMEEYQPATQTQITLIETMAVARWRQLRVWGAQKTALDRDMALQDPAVGPAPVRALFALRGSADSACPPELLLRYEIAFDHQFIRALTRLLALRAKPSSSQATPYFPTAPAGQTWKPSAPPKEDPPNQPPLRNEPRKLLKTTARDLTEPNNPTAESAINPPLPQSSPCPANPRLAPPPQPSRDRQGAVAMRPRLTRKPVFLPCLPSAPHASLGKRRGVFSR